MLAPPGSCPVCENAIAGQSPRILSFGLNGRAFGPAPAARHPKAAIFMPPDALSRVFREIARASRSFPAQRCQESCTEFWYSLQGQAACAPWYEADPGPGSGIGPCRGTGPDPPPTVPDKIGTGSGARINSKDSLEKPEVLFLKPAHPAVSEMVNQQIAVRVRPGVPFIVFPYILSRRPYRARSGDRS